MKMEMKDREPAYRDLALHFDALRLAALREGGWIEEILATENGGKVLLLLRAPAHVNSAHAALCCWREAYSPLPARSANWLDGPCLASCSMHLGVILDLTL